MRLDRHNVPTTPQSITLKYVIYLPLSYFLITQTFMYHSGHYKNAPCGDCQARSKA
jgi:hypothetical protein